jgi:hypothetical protein
MGVLASKIFWYLFGQILRGESWNNGAPGYVNDFFAREF